MAASHRNLQAAALLYDLRRERGLTPEDLSYEIFKAGLGPISARTIRRVEATGMVPRVRAQFALAQFFDRSVSSIWPARPVRVRAAA